MEIKGYVIKWKLSFCFATIIMLASCKKENDTTNVNLPVVEGYLIPGNKIKVKLYQQKALTDTASHGAPITGLQLSISDGSSSVLLTEAPAGTYNYSGQNFLTAGKTYSLNFRYLSYHVSASTVMPPKTSNFATSYGTINISTTTSPGQNTTIYDRLSWDNPDSLNHVLVFLNADKKDFPLGSFGSGDRPYNFTLNTYRSSFYNVTRNIFPYYGHYQIILYSVNQEYIDLLNSNTSSATSSTLNNVPTNVINGFGIFTAMQADTVRLNVF